MMAVKGMPQPPKPFTAKAPKHATGGVLQYFSAAKTGHQGAIAAYMKNQAVYEEALQAYREFAILHRCSGSHPELQLAAKIRANSKSKVHNMWTWDTEGPKLLATIAKKEGGVKANFVPGLYKNPTEFITDLCGAGYLDKDKTLELLREIEEEGGKAGEKTKAFLEECDKENWIYPNEYKFMAQFAPQADRANTDSIHQEHLFQTIKEQSAADPSAIIRLIEARRELETESFVEREAQREAKRQTAQTEQAEGQTRAQSR